MATTKLQLYSELARRQAEQVTRGRGNWTAFLDTAARLYKYPFNEQLLIYAQRPDATACASIELWNDPMRRLVRRGTAGIALIDDTGSRPRLKYVFDVADTEPARENARTPYLWEMREEHEAPVMDAFTKTYDDVSGSFADTLFNIASQLADEYYSDNAREIRYSAEDSFLEEYDDFNLGVVYRNALTVSVAYSVMSRCGIDTNYYFEDEDFQPIYDFNTPAAVYALGTAVSDLSEQVLRDIEITIKKYERQHAAERSAEHERNERANLQPRGGLYDTRPDSVGAARGIDGADRQIRQDAPKLSQGTPGHNVQYPAAERDAVSPPAGDRPGGQRADGAVNEGADGEQPAPGQGSRSNELGTAHEQPEIAGRGNDNERPDIQLNEDAELPPEQSGGISLPENAEPGAYRYYSVRRPVDIGTYPGNPRPIGIVNFDSRTPVEDGAFEAWGYLEYDRPLTDKQIDDYELRAAQGNSLTSPQVGNMSEHATPEQPAPAPEATRQPEVSRLPERPTEPLYVALAGSSITVDTVDTVLRDGGNRGNSVLRIAAYFMKDKTAAENADFLRREYATGRLSQPGGKGFQIGARQTAVWFDDTGILIGRGKSALHARDSAHITWEQAAVRVRELLDAGQYVSRDVMDEALDNEHRELAEGLLHLYRDDFRDFAEFPEGWRGEGGWPGDIARVTELLKDKAGEYNEYSMILEGLEEDVAALATDPDAPTRLWHDPHQLLQDVRDLGITPRYFPAAEMPAAPVRFITEDEVDAYLTRGSSFNEGKYRILSYFLHEHTPKERADFLKKEYGHGGQSHALSGADKSWADCEPGKGITLKLGGLSEPYDTVTLSWSAAEKRINKLIQDGRYMSRAGLDRIPEYERMILAREIQNFHYNMPPEYERPFSGELNFSYPHDEERTAISGLLDNPERIDAVLAAMRLVMEDTPSEDRYYNLRQRAYNDLTAWRDGAYTLFPGVMGLPDPELAAAPVEKPPAQLTLFDASPQPVLPSVEAQREIVAEAVKAEEAKDAPAVPPITQDEIDALLVGALENPDSRARVQRQFAENPRSREAALVLKEAYSRLVYTMPRMTRTEGYLGLLGEDSGVAIAKGAPATPPLNERPPAQTLTLTWPKLQKRVAELVEVGRFMAVGAPEQDVGHLPTAPESEQAQAPAASAPITQEDIDAALRRWNGDEDSKLRVYRYMLTHARARDTADYLKNRYGGEQDAFTVEKDGAEPVALPWPRVQRRIAQLIDAEQYLTPEETERLNARAGQDAEQGETSEPVQEAETPAVPGRSYAVGDTVYLENDKPYVIEHISYDIRLNDPTLTYPISRSESRESFERLLLRNPKNKVFTDFLASDLDSFNADLRDVLENDLLAPQFKTDIIRLTEAGATNDALASYLSDTFPNEVDTVTLETGDTADYTTTPRGISVEILDKYSTTLGLSWAEAAPVVRSLSREWTTEREPHAPEQSELSGILLEYEAFQNRYPGAVIAFQRGDSYMIYGENALKVRELLERKVLLMSLPDGGLMNYTGLRIDREDEYLDKIRASGFGFVFVGKNPPELQPYIKHEINISAEPAQAVTEPAAASVLVEPDFDMVAATVLERVMQDEDYLSALASATSRAALRNPCTWALEQSIRDHEQDEPAVYHKYFSDYDWNERLFSHVLRESWANRPQPEKAASEQTAPEPEQPRSVEMTVDADDDLSDIDVAYIREHLENPTPEDIARVEGMLVAAEEAARQFDRENGIEPEPGEQDEQEPLDYSVGDTVRLENGRAYVIDEIADFDIRLRDRITSVPRTVSVFEFERLLREYPGNDHLFPERQEQAAAERPAPKPVNFRITDDHLGEGGLKTKYGYNIAAIRALKQIEAEGRAATREEQETLSRYVGWGSLPQAFEADRDGWQKEYAELQDLLTPEEYKSARASTLNSHYTSPTVIKAMYEAVERMGFKTGNVLEPSCGVGNFFGLLPGGMRGAKLYGVELDSVSGRIASYLYPDADIQVAAFEDTNYPDAFFDLAIGNIPFGNYGVADMRYKQDFHVHDYFFAKALDQVRPGGIVAFVTSKYTLDKKNPEVRKYIARRAELLGAVRLPNDAFQKNAGTNVTADILFLQKRDRLIDIEPDWVHLGRTSDGVPVNSYFTDNPEMILGTMAFDESMYGGEKDTACKPIPGADLARQLRDAVSNIRGQITENELDDIEGAGDTSIPADPTVRNFSYTVVDDVVYFRENSRMYPLDLPGSELERIKGMIGLRDCTHELIALQLGEYGNAEIKAKQEELSGLYDGFAAEYGLINSAENAKAFSGDSAYYLLCSLEILDEDGEFERKADMFTKRTIKQKTVITSVDTASEALAVSIGERACIDLGFMASLMGDRSSAGGSEKIPDIVRDLRGVIFKDPATGPFDFEQQWYAGWQTADEYLSGDVREKLAIARRAAEQWPEFEVNVAALEKAQPKELEAGEIAVRLGTTWIDKSYVQQFMYELLQSPESIRKIAKVDYFDFTGEWRVTGKGRIPWNNVRANVTYGTSRMNAYQIIEETLNLRDARVYDTITGPDGKEKRVLNKKETTLAQQKQEAIKQAFKDWIWQDPYRRQRLTTLYNMRFNSTRPREYDGRHINFSGIAPDIKLDTHQLNAVARGLYGGNSLFAHDVGAGKTFEMTALAMEAKRLGLCHKSLIAVPNHLPGDWASQFLRLYPSANILVATKKDFEMRNRKKFCAKIATGDYDAVIIAHSQLEKIPISRERQIRLLEEQVSDITDGIERLKRMKGENFSIKQLEKTRKSLQARLTRLTESKTRDDVVTFEQLGIDRLFIDEAHNYKNLFLYTKMRNVAGLSTAEAQKSSDLFLKCRYIDELTNGRGVIFATGTPISNSMTELYTMQRYLQFDTLNAMRMMHFDSWASTFGETVNSVELAPEGTGYRARTRFSKFHNLPELMGMFKDVADIQTAEMLNLPRPKANYHTVVVEPSEMQKAMVQELSSRAALVHKGDVDPTEDNMLKIITDGRKIGLDQRLMNPSLPDDPGSKVNACMENVYRIWDETKAERLTQLIFCDFSTPNKDKRFNLYDDIRGKLLKKGVPEHEIAFIHEADSDEKKKELFAKVRKGQIRVLLGSTQKMGTGTNVQNKLIATHDLDCPWRPSDLEQRAGRIVRRGNDNTEVDIYRYVTNGTFDAYLWQTVENKQKFISQVMSGKSPVRSCEDVDETVLSYAEIKALCAGDVRIKEKMDLDIEVARLRLIKSEHQNEHYRLQDNLIKYYPESIEQAKEHIAGYEKDIALLAEHAPPPPDAASHSDEAATAKPGAQAEQDNAKPETAAIPTAATGAAPAKPETAAPAKPEAATENPEAAPAPRENMPPMVIGGVTYTNREKAGHALLGARKGVKNKEPVKIGAYQGFDMNLSYDIVTNQYRLTLKGAMSYGTELSDDVYGNITRIGHTLSEIPQRLKSTRERLENLYQQMADAERELKSPFAQEAELAEKEARLAMLNAELNIDGTMGAETEDIGGQQIISAKNVKPSILEGLRSYGAGKEPGQPDKPKTNDRLI